MRIARVLTRLNLGGPARQALASDPLLSARGHEVRLFAGSPEPGEGDLYDTFLARGVDVVRVPGLGRRVSVTGDLRAARFLRAELTAFQPDIVHTHASKAGALGRRAARKLNAATVHTFHGHVLEGYFPPTLSRALIAHERRAARRTDRVLAVSHATAEDLLRLEVVDEDRLVVVPPGVDIDGLMMIDGHSGVVRNMIGAEPGALVVAALGRLAEVKRPERAIEAFEALAERYPGLHLAFVGDGSERGRLERRIQAGPEAVRSRVHILGALDDIPAVLADVDVVVSTSRSEGLPVALIEAAAAGLPVVATDVGGVSELVAHERTGFLAGDVDEVAYFLSQLLEQPRLRKEMGHRARLRVEKRHSAQALAGRLEGVYAACLEPVT